MLSPWLGGKHDALLYLLTELALKDGVDTSWTIHTRDLQILMKGQRCGTFNNTSAGPLKDVIRIGDLSEATKSIQIRPEVIQAYRKALRGRTGLGAKFYEVKDSGAQAIIIYLMGFIASGVTLTSPGAVIEDELDDRDDVNGYRIISCMLNKVKAEWEET